MAMKLLIGGSPCTYWSVCRNKGAIITRETTSEGIGWELFKNYVVAVEKFNPDIFLYENVVSMSNDIKEQISVNLGTQPLRINGALVSAAERDRYFWTNIKAVKPPKERGLVLADVLEEESLVDEKYYYNRPLQNVDMSKQVCAEMVFKTTEMNRRVFNPNFKCHTLTTCGGGNTQKKVMVNGRVRKLTPVEYERCMTLPDGYTKAVADTHRYTGCGNGWTAEVIIHLLNHALKNVPKDEELTVLSLYDGIGTGRYCLDKMGFTNVKYHAYEIDKYAMAVASDNYPDIRQLGDAFAVREDEWLSPETRSEWLDRLLEVGA